MRASVIGTGLPSRVNEALDEIHSHWPIEAIAIRDEDNPAAAWARRHAIPIVSYIPNHMIDMGLVFPTGEDAVEARHARLLMDNVPCMEIHP